MSLEYGVKLCPKCEFFTNFQNLLKEKDKTYPFKLYISPQNSKDFPPEAHTFQE